MFTLDTSPAPDTPDALAALSAGLLLEDLVTPPTDDPAWDDLIHVTHGADSALDERTALVAFFVDAAVDLGLDAVQVPDTDEMRALLSGLDAERARAQA